jgi:hypothetical protein
MKMLKSILLALGLCFTLSTLAKAQADMTFTEHTFDFGKVKQGSDTLWHDFVFINNGLEPLVIKSVNTSCDCTLAEWSKGKVIQPGQRSVIKGGYKIEGKPTGAFDKSIIIIANTTPATIFLTIKGELIE